MRNDAEAGGWRPGPGKSPDTGSPAPGPQSPASVFDLSEAELIARIASRLPAAPGWMVVGIGDDAAVVEPERNRLEVLSVDALVDGVHFDRAFTPPAAIGHRALAVNLSDLAAMGAAPRLALLSLALPPSLAIADFDGIVDGLTQLAVRSGVAIAGGNLTRTPGPLTLDVTVIGTVKRRQALIRGGARPGDDLYVSGSVGAAAAGLAMLRAREDAEGAKDAETIGGNHARSTSVLSSVSSAASASSSCIQRYLYPQPRLRLGTQLSRNRAATACMDLSDGLADAVRHMAEASGVGARIDAEAIPIDAAARRWFDEHGGDAVLDAIAGGDDYELLFAVRPRLRNRLAAAERHGGVPLTRIGSCTADRAIVLHRNGSDRALPQGYHHFR